MEQNKEMDRLAEIFGKENVLKDEPMSRHTTFRIGGAADFFVKVQTISQLQEAMRYLKKEQIPFYIVGNGSNLLVRDEGAVSSCSGRRGCRPLQ